ncbi:hypothetical protein EMPS_06395 [Entomortierella parvispora]|uniref:F-box/LRR-repeat protein 15/At3g58940/PEG3-like LRR domain-containing protein n=1 Tax=Entomortierella parvispora TaxID=205924 RepID=A0A9P3HCD0_9FUNG|nr:hypothetical protein EMPS_06395 [Entomortierella parvispora]
MDLCDIQLHVGQYLRRPDLARCVQVSKDWHKTYMPLLFRDLELVFDVDDEDLEDQERPTKNKMPSVGSVEGYGHSIRSLSVHVKEWSDAGSLSLLAYWTQNIKWLSVRGAYGAENCWTGTAHLLCNNPGIRYLDLEYLDEDDDCLSYIIDTCTQLTELRMSHAQLDVLQMGYLMSSSPSLGRLTLEGCGICFPVDQSLDSLPLFLPIEELDLDHNFEPGLAVLVRWTARCPNLRLIRLKNVPYMEGEEVSDFSLFQHCPRLSKMTLSGLYLEDADLAAILAHCPSLVDLTLEGQDIGKRAFEIMAGLFKNLIVLDLYNASNLDTEMYRRICTSCTRLENLAVSKLDVDDYFAVGSDVEQEAMGNHWICSGLRSLRIKVLVWSLNTELGNRALQEMEALKGLEVLEIEYIGRPVGEDVRFYKKLSLSVAHASEEREIAGLARLCKKGRFARSQLQQDMDLQWMAESWPRMKRFIFVDQTS